MAAAGRNHNVSTTGDHDAAVHTPMLASYRRPSSPPLADHLLDKQPEQQSAKDWLPSFWPLKTDDGQAAISIDWPYVRRTCKAWLKNPMNIALLLWLLCVGVSGGMLVLLLLGLLDGAFPAPASRNGWIETNNQVLNALFTLMSVYQHPALCHHLFLLCRWRAPHDVAHLRAVYCKDGSSTRRGERFHLGVVVALLHLTVACQYVLCGLYWGYTKATRPELLEDGFFVLGVAAPVAAAAYTACSPLGKSDQPPDLFLVTSDATAIEEEKPMMEERNAAVVVVVEPEWAGGMFDLAGDPAAAVASLSCTYCVFGWNAERLGFGNRYVHAATFALLCFAPLWVLGVSALHIHQNLLIGDAVGGAGVVLCAGGLLYGGYWRIQMRRRFGLPGSKICCGSKSLTDYARWLFCWPCALAQEIRTASLYHVAGETFYSKVDDDERQPLLKCTSHHDVSCARDTDTMVVQVSPNDHLVLIHDDAMVPPPVQVVLVQVEDDDDKTDDCSVVLHGQMIDSPNPVSATVLGDDVSLLEDADHSISSDGRWRVDKVKKLINMVSLLILMYTRGFIR